MEMNGRSGDDSDEYKGDDEHSASSYSAINDNHYLPPSTTTNDGGHHTSHQRSVRQFSVQQARSLAARGELRLALFQYFTALGCATTHFDDAEERAPFLDEFTDVLRAFLIEQSADDSRQWATGRDEQQTLPKISGKLFELSTELFPRHYPLWRLWAEQHFSEGMFLQSICAFEKSLEFARDDHQWIDAATNIENVKSNLIDFWHWRMLNDRRRNEAFATAIDRALNRLGSSSRLLDIGSGSGIFSIVAARSPKCQRVIACDHDEFMFQIGGECVQRSGVKRKVDLHKAHSRDLALSEQERCNILVTETFECAVFGEHIVETIADARRRLLSSNPLSIIIPSKAAIIVALAECPAILHEHILDLPNRCSSSATTIVSEFCSIDANELPPSPYTCDFVGDMKDCRLLSAPVEAFEVDFAGPLDVLDQIAASRFNAPAIVPVEHDGEACALIVWFRVSVSDQNDSQQLLPLELCSSPANGLCWQQAVFPFWPSRFVQSGDQLSLELLIRQHTLNIRHRFLPRHDDATQVLRASAGMDLAAANCCSIQNFFLESIEKGVGTDGRQAANVLDSTDLFIFATKKVQDWISESSRSVIFNVLSDRPVVRLVADQLGLGTAPMTVSNNKTFGFASLSPSSPSLLLYWPFSSRGLLQDDNLVAVIEHWIRSVSQKQSLSLMPAKIVLRGLLFHSPSLADQSRLVPPADRARVYCGATLDPMEAYRTAHCHELNPCTLRDFVRLSSPADLLRFDFSGEQPREALAQLTQIRRERIIHVGENAESNQNRTSVAFASTDDDLLLPVCHGLLYWFAVAGVSGGVEGSRGAGDEVFLDLLEDGPSGRASAFVFDAPISGLTKRDAIQFDVSTHHGVILIDNVARLLSTTAHSLSPNRID